MDIGYKCPFYGNVGYSKCFTCPDEICGLPLPYRRAAGNDREHEPDTYHVTEILNPDKQIFLERKYDFYTDPYRKVFSTFGTAWHGVAEKYAKNDPRYLQEVEFRALVGDVYLSGRCDLVDLKRVSIEDWKTTAAYKVKKAMKGDYDDWSKQQNIYRPFILPDAKALKIIALARDWKKSQDANYCKPVEPILLPIMDENEVLAYAVDRLETLSSYKDESELPDCTPEECWENWHDWRRKDYLVRNKCEDYCGAGGDSNICQQYVEWANRQ